MYVWMVVCIYGWLDGSVIGLGEAFRAGNAGPGLGGVVDAVVLGHHRAANEAPCLAHVERRPREVRRVLGLHRVSE